MKKRIIYVTILSAMICATILSGCNNAEVTSNDTEPVTTTTAIVTTVAPTTQATETTVTLTTELETTVAQTEAETESQVTEPQTEAPKTETEKPETNKPSNNNSNGNTTTTQKPTQNTNNSNQSDKKPNNTTQIITDDTKLTHKQFSTSANMKRVATSLNNYYVGKGMTLNTSLTTDNSGWMFAYQGELNTTANRSYNEQYNRIVTGLDEQIDAFLQMSEAVYSDLSFNCYAEMQSDGEYHIYFCHE